MYLPSGTYDLTGSLEIPWDSSVPSRPIVLLGDGQNATSLRAPGPFGGPDLLLIRRSNVIVRAMTIDGRFPTSVDSFRGVVIDGSVGPLSGIELADIIIRRTSSRALHVVPGPGQNVISRVRCRRCTFASNGRHGAVRIEPGAFGHGFLDCHIDFFGDVGMDLQGCEDILLHNCVIEAPAALNSTQPYLRAVDVRNCQVINAWFEEPENHTESAWFIDLQEGCHGWTVMGPHFVRKTGVGGHLRAVRVGTPSGPCLGVVILNPYLRRDSTEPPQPGHIEINNCASECLVVGGTVETGFNPISRFPLDVVDHSRKSGWIGHRRWILPRLDPSEDQTTGRHHGDLVARPGRGVEAWAAFANGPSWLPLTDNRVPTEDALLSIVSKNRGSMAWVDRPPAGKKNLRVWDGTTWKGINLTG